MPSPDEYTGLFIAAGLDSTGTFRVGRTACGFPAISTQPRPSTLTTARWARDYILSIEGADFLLTRAADGGDPFDRTPWYAALRSAHPDTGDVRQHISTVVRSVHTSKSKSYQATPPPVRDRQRSRQPRHGLLAHAS